MLIKLKIHNSKEIYIGIQLLRFLFCLWIVILHCAIIKNEHKIYFNKGFHVPSFILISFYFFYPNIKNRIISKIKARFQRLLYPYILWPIIIFIINNLLITIISFGIYNNKLMLKDIYLQIIIGAQYHAIFWFQFNLIFISLFLSIISFIFKNNALRVFEYLGIISLYIHFSGINFYMFNSLHRRYQITLGGLAELTPLAIIGCILSSINFLVFLKNKLSLHHHIILYLFILFLFRYSIFKLYFGFRYPNILLNILASIILFISFGTINLDKFLVVITIIKLISKFTGGIYYIHPILRVFLKKYILFFSKRTYFSSFVIYIFCYLICYIGLLLFKNNKLKYLFT